MTKPIQPGMPQQGGGGSIDQLLQKLLPFMHKAQQKELHSLLASFSSPQQEAQFLHQMLQLQKGGRTAEMEQLMKEVGGALNAQHLPYPDSQSANTEEINKILGLPGDKLTEYLDLGIRINELEENPAVSQDDIASLYQQRMDLLYS